MANHICATCVKEFKGVKTRKYCSRECFRKSLIKWREFTCLNCGVVFKRTATWRKRGMGKYCSIECAHAHNRGEDHVNWKGGGSEDRYPSAFNKALRYKVRQRDNFKCRICGCKEGDIPHDVHHKDANKANSSPDNLVTLCSDCHQHRVHSPSGEGLEYWAERLT